MNKKILFMIFYISSSMAIEAKTNIIYMGGGGEGQKDTTIFDKNITDMKAVIENKKWDYDISFNGGHKKTEAILKESFPKKANKTFTKESYLTMLSEIKQKINNNQIKNGEQIVLVLDSHGAHKTNEKSHSISITGNSAVTNYDSLAGNGLVSVDRIQEIINLSESKGIKLAIVDFSCHSGSTLNLAHNQSKTCIVTATGPDHYAFAGKNSFANEFIKQLASSSKTIESAFLNARRLSNDNGYPMISTPQAELIKRSLYELITPYFQYQTTSIGKLKNDIIDLADKCYECNNTSMNTLISKLERLRSYGTIGNKETLELIAKIKEYEKHRTYLVGQYSALKFRGSKNVESFTTREINPVTKKPFFNISYSWNELIKIDEIKIERMSNSLIQKAKKEKLANFEIYKKAVTSLKVDILKRKQAVLRSNPALLTIEKDFNAILLQSKNTFNLANDVSKLERAIYNDLYTKNNSTRSNACGNIVI